MKIEFLAQSKSADSLPKPSLPEIAFVGRSNVGKSSLLNTVVGQKIARSSSTPGRTQGLVFFKVRPGLIFVDFPGYGYAKISKAERESWASLAEEYFRSRRTLRGSVWVFDIRRDPDELDFQMKEWLLFQEKPFLLALTKADTIGRVDWENRKKEIAQSLAMDENQVVVFSSKTKEGAKLLLRIIEGL